jgi:hypothetical protein
MKEGFVLDNVHGGRGVASWVEGAPEKSIWVGVKLGRKKPVEISVWRCTRCGYLEQYEKGDAR